MTSVVITGRRMQSSERRMRGLPSRSDPALAAAVHAPLLGCRRAAGRTARLLDGNRYAGRQSDLAVRHHALTGIQAGAHVRGLADDALDRNCARGNLVVRAD